MHRSRGPAGRSGGPLGGSGGKVLHTQPGLEGAGAVAVDREGDHAHGVAGGLGGPGVGVGGWDGLLGSRSSCV